MRDWSFFLCGKQNNQVANKMNKGRTGKQTNKCICKSLYIRVNWNIQNESFTQTQVPFAYAY